MNPEAPANQKDWIYQFQQRTKRFALDCIRISQSATRTYESLVLLKQLVRSSTSVGANYRAACRSKSKADFIYKLAIVVEEADETVYWLELLPEAGFLAPETGTSLVKRRKRFEPL